ncbi:Ger(x)C family spore germination protein [Clostridium sp. D2Q-11]|uniref:Ger(X)C family spore germination protein n=1 Tax=Anaeromonas frigoriresistens TaxID=2683708 RepID=A0A942Z798_9FIRM|nr:Ger(x)C family spore germination protein [Anaeromonas frigoriresistens]MBS4539331.1 Ger(x)C family spore germination protein [Anaeromonas frigoriresistens]
MERLLHRLTLITIIFFIMLETSGCWDNVPITEKAMVMGVGIDKTEDNMIELTLQVVKPTSINYGEGSQGSSDTVWVYSTKGKTLFKAMRNQLQTINRKPFYSHVQVIIIGDELAKTGIQEVIDLFERDREPRLSPTVLIAKETTAKKVLSAKSDLENVPAMHIMEILLNNKNNFGIHNMSFINLIRNLRYPGQNPTVGVIEIENEKNDLNIADMKVKGGAILKKDKFIGWLDEKDIEGLNYVLNTSHNGIIETENPFNKGKFVTIEQKRSDTTINVKFEDEKLVFMIEVDAEGNIGGEEGEADLTTKDALSNLEGQIEKSIKEKIENIISLAQDKYKSDVFGFGEKLNKKYPYYWEEVKPNWSEEFSHSLIEVNVKFEIRNSGLINHPTKVE